MSLESSSCLTMYGSNKLERKKEDKKKRARERRIVERGAEIVVRKRELIETCQRWVAWCGTHSPPHGPPHLISHIYGASPLFTQPPTSTPKWVACIIMYMYMHLYVYKHTPAPVYIYHRGSCTLTIILLYILLYYSIYIYIYYMSFNLLIIL